MTTVTLSADFRLTLPAAARRSLDIKAGQDLVVFAYGDRIELIPVRPMASMRGFLKGIDTTVPREPDDSHLSS